MGVSFTNPQRPGVVVLALAAAGALGAPSPCVAQQPSVACAEAKTLQRVAELPEGSGIAASRRTQGRFWSHNDSGEPILVALDGAGRVVGRLTVSGAAVEDWEAVAVGPCPSGSCVYVADIGDNDAERNRIAVYRFVEPAEPSGSATVVDVFHATYPDGAHDAESLLVTPEGRLYIVTKGDTGPVALYRFPDELRSGSTHQLERVGQPRGQSGARDRVTDGAVSPDGHWVVLRTRQALTFYTAADLLAGNWREAGRVGLEALGEPQGEGVTFASNGSVYLISEGGGRKRPGTFARLPCTLGR